MLQRLVVMKNLFIGPTPTELSECKLLIRIRISKNFLKATIPPGFFNLPLVNMLEFSDNHFSGEHPDEISSEILGLLMLSNNVMTQRIPKAIGRLTNLRILSLDINQFTGEIPPEMFQLKSLSKININNNNLTGLIPSTLSRCSSLTSIQIKGLETDSIPETWFQSGRRNRMLERREHHQQRRCRDRLPGIDAGRRGCCNQVTCWSE
ncbi:receptor protein kinase CLAVATA1-like [Macadamia integrifolia]|uniref:receptor protein kinase CLAVATA1-like n=1 Tax=Macadamia integrifolia TaxID=60698 RepID=UPI001C4EB753|nr:receptor protein kinase CLAVATA1-like [Macadamia integrifolia]